MAIDVSARGVDIQNAGDGIWIACESHRVGGCPQLHKGKSSVFIRAAVMLSCVTLGASICGIACSQSADVAESAVAVTDAPSSAPARPTMAATQPIDYPGLHNVVAYSDDVWSGSVPEGADGFATLRALGVRTILTVDGAAPDLEAARQVGLRYVHLPIGYNGMDEQRTLEIARAIQDLPKPIYVHCHHGKHRSAAAAGAALVTLGKLNNDEAVARMKISGTAADYTGLYQCVNVASIARADQLLRADASFPQTYKTSGMVQSMVEIDAAFDQLKLIEKAGWQTPTDHPDLVPAAEAGRLADHFRILADEPESDDRPADFAQRLRDDAQRASAIEEGLLASTIDRSVFSAQMASIGQSCKSCHAAYRD